MPKREKSPSPAREEKFYVVYCPYPGSDIAVLEDRKMLAYWLVCILDNQDYLITLRSKPSAPNMIIFEVSESFNEPRKLLGAHKWSDVLTNPSSDEMERVSMIYRCKLHNNRMVQKLGWKEWPIEDSWFQEKRWQSIQRVIKYPYPLSHRCDTPGVDHDCLCHPLSTALFPLPAVQAPRPVPVGSEAWLESKDTPSRAYHAPKCVPVRSAAWSESKNVGPAINTSAGGAWARGPPTTSRKCGTPHLTQRQSISATSAAKVGIKGITSHSASVQSDPPQLSLEALSLSADDTDSPISEWGDIIPVKAHTKPVVVDPNDDLWGGYTEHTDNKVTCPVHGKVCNPGICAAMEGVLEENKSNNKMKMKKGSVKKGERGSGSTTGLTVNRGKRREQRAYQVNGDLVEGQGSALSE
ncbi:hypothetical protein NEOLEDRAFT_1169657 [Neolentinus lepideus HHB14362 ss-1]|uniref:Uncharacterized protein n=1 Tax=Neolentinus lepideus HHB14362 ss-1 TaxID=1314782 RepID=A0A165SIR4_9AGAM|nr:hypothetical protein NEOLEDRAFT_1169657 [Neolentinus lepideus HHB14362 ss-1]